MNSKGVLSSSADQDTEVDVDAVFKRFDAVIEELKTVVASVPGTPAARKAEKTLRKLGVARRKKRLSFTLWLAGLIVAGGLAYPLSIGPALLLGFLPTTRNRLAYRIYQPVEWVIENGPMPARAAVIWYANLWVANEAPPKPPGKNSR